MKSIASRNQMTMPGEYPHWIKHFAILEFYDKDTGKGEWHSLGYDTPEQARKALDEYVKDLNRFKTKPENGILRSMAEN